MGVIGYLASFQTEPSREIAQRLDRTAFANSIKLLICLPSAKAVTILDQAVTFAPSPEWADGVKAMAAAMRAGETEYKTLKGFLPSE